MCVRDAAFLRRCSPVAQSQQIEKRILFHFWHCFHAGIKFDSAKASGGMEMLQRKTAVIGDETENSQRNSQPFHVLASLRNGIAAATTIASA
jgi:hypothetical protein